MLHSDHSYCELEDVPDPVQMVLAEPRDCLPVCCVMVHGGDVHHELRRYRFRLVRDLLASHDEWNVLARSAASRCLGVRQGLLSRCFTANLQPQAIPNSSRGTSAENNHLIFYAVVLLYLL